MKTGSPDVKKVDVVIVGGAEKMTDLDDDSVNEVMNGTSDADWEAGM